MEKTEAESLQIRRLIAASPEKVFQAWTQPEHLMRWFAPSDEFTTQAEIDLREGGSYRVKMKAPDGTVHDLHGTYREVLPPRKLVYTWRWATEPEHGETLVTVEFHEREGKTELVLTHQQFPGSKAREEHTKGWSGCLDRLSRYFPN